MGRKGQWWNSKSKRGDEGKPAKNERAKQRKPVIKTVEEYTPAPNVTTLYDHGIKAECVYRYFDVERYADAFVLGDILISTLETCRRYEDPQRGDPHEGYQHYSTGQMIVGNSSDPDFVRMAAQAGIFVGAGARRVTISNAVKTDVLRDAYILCTTIGFASEALEDNFGKYCVKISNLRSFFEVVTAAMSQRFGKMTGIMNEVTYRERSYSGLENSPGHLGFVKPPDKYASQQEFRFLWSRVDTADIEPFVLKCPQAAEFITRVK
jgi:hypothetical protein